MARIDTVPNFCTDIANAIRKKTGTTDKILAKDFDIKIDEISSGIDINGIIEEYKVSSDGNVNAGDFVRFLTDYSESNKGNDTAIKSISSFGYIISAVALSENKVFIAHSFSSADINNYLYGIVCIISENTILVGDSVKLSALQRSGSTISAVALNDSKVFIAHQGGSSSVLTSIVCTINETTISVGEQTQLSGTANSGKVISAVKLDEGRVFIVHSYGANYYLYGMVCTIIGTSISKGTDTQLSNITGSGNKISVVELAEGKVFVAHNYSSNIVVLYGIICTINGVAITKGTDTQLSNLTDSGKVISAGKLNENKVIIAYTAANAYVLEATIILINDMTPISQGEVDLGLKAGTGNISSVVALNENKVQITHGHSNNYLYSTLCEINGTIVVKKSDIQLSSVENSGHTISAVKLSEKDMFIAYSGDVNYYLYGMTLGYLENLVKSITLSTEEIDGVAIIDGQAGEMVQVKKPM